MPQIINWRWKGGSNDRSYAAGMAPWIVLVALLFLSIPQQAYAAAGDDEYKAGVQAEARQDFDEAYRQYQAAVQADPRNPQFLIAFERARFQAAAIHVDRGNKLQNQGNLEEAATEYEIASAIDPGSPIARQALQMVRSKIQDLQRGVVADEGIPSLEDALGPPVLRPLSLAPINFLATNDSKIVTETIAKMAGINVLFDPDYTGRRISVEFNNVTYQEALDHIALLTRTFWKPVTQNTIMVIPDTAVKRREQEQQIIKTFYLSNTITPQELTEVVTAIRTLLETRRIQQVNSMNAIILRDTPDKVALAEKIIRDVDKAKPEVIVDVAVLEVRRDKARQLGFAPGLPGLQIPLTFTPGGRTSTTTTGTTTTTTTTSSNSVTLKDLGSVGSGDWSLTLPGAQLNALLTDSHTKILQRPEVRASDGMKATLRIGDKVPVATGAYQPGIAGQAVSALVNTQFQYQDVGVNVDITPKVHQNQEITLKVRVEVSAVTQTAEPVPGVKQPVIGQRVIEHDIRLREGEMNILGGILQTGTTRQVSGIPGLSQIPLLKYLFSNVSDSVAEDEVLIVLRPRTVRLPDITPLNRRAIDIGTEGDVRLREAAPPFEEGTAPAAPPADAPATPGVAPQSAPEAPPVPVAPPGPTASAPVAATEYARLQFQGENLSPQSGETFEVPVRIENAHDVYSFPFELQYDSAAMKLLGVKKGDFWTADGQPVAVVERPEEEAGNTVVTMTRPPGSGGVSGSGTIAVLTFQAERAGNTSLGIISTGARTPESGFLPVQSTQAMVTIR
ncbi:MAG: type II and III secretion system protein [Acidobacteria bacterium]|nr:type II and III secretion system protein [Acidobacteriota bacterium]